jgi:hypothetical protein
MPWNTPWCEEELGILRLFYRQRGALFVQKILQQRGFERSKHAITDRANKLGYYVQPGAKRKMVPLVEAHYRRIYSNDTRLAHYLIVQAATRDGVLERAPVYPHTHLAPEWWVDQYIERLAAQEEAEAEIARTWLQTVEVAELFRASPRVIATLATPKRAGQVGPLGQAVRRIPTLQFVAPKARNVSLTRYWKPEAAREEAARYLALPKRKWGGGRRASNHVMEGRTP